MNTEEKKDYFEYRFKSLYKYLELIIVLIGIFFLIGAIKIITLGSNIYTLIGFAFVFLALLLIFLGSYIFLNSTTYFKIYNDYFITKRFNKFEKIFKNDLAEIKTMDPFFAPRGLKVLRMSIPNRQILIRHLFLVYEYWDKKQDETVKEIVSKLKSKEKELDPNI